MVTLQAVLCLSSAYFCSMGSLFWFAVEPEDCFLNNSRVLTIATSFGFAIFVTVYLSASFSGALFYWLSVGLLVICVPAASCGALGLTSISSSHISSSQPALQLALPAASHMLRSTRLIAVPDAGGHVNPAGRVAVLHAT